MSSQVSRHANFLDESSLPHDTTAWATDSGRVGDRSVKAPEVLRVVSRERYSPTPPGSRALQARSPFLVLLEHHVQHEQAARLGRRTPSTVLLPLAGHIRRQARKVHTRTGAAQKQITSSCRRQPYHLRFSD
ncbi:hypothetical protein ON010_g14692 [Phytophthora cinnamomi]|nr:hypothetical protein ON010_g14692 [Phytophthora cinnamomi]